MARVGRYGPPLALMALIWVLSDQPDLNSGLDQDKVLRKLGHMAVFGTLLLLWWRAVGPTYAVLITLGWAMLDEHHQSWVEGRHGTVSDVAIDLAGMGVAAAVAVWRIRRRQHAAPA